MTALMTAPRAWARVAGICWLLCILFGTYTEGMVRPALFVHGDAAATLHNILAHEAMYRLGIASEFLGTAVYLVMTPILYLLLAPINRTVSLIAASFSVAGCTIWFFNVVFNSAPLILLTGGHATSGTAALAQNQTLAYSALRLGNEVLLTGMLCFGVQCLLAGGLLLRATFFPRPIGLVLALGGLGYLVSGLAQIASPPLSDMLGNYGYMPGQAGELLMGAWLTVFGVNPAKWQAQATAG